MDKNQLYSTTQHAAQTGRTIRMPVYSISGKASDAVKIILQAYLDHNNCSELHGTIFTMLKELMINAVKANFKNIYFENYAPKNSSRYSVSYETALKLFSLEMHADRIHHMERMAQERKIHTDLIFSCHRGLLYIEISNPAGMTGIELENVQRKLSLARKCADISEYFMLETDDPHKEGAGLGLILIMMILRSLGLGEYNFSLRSANGRTTASIVIPLPETSMTSVS